MAEKYSKVFHAVMTGYYLWLNYQHYQIVTYLVTKDVFRHLTGGGMELFTVWTQILQQVYFYLCFVMDILDFSTHAGCQKLKSRLDTIIKHYMYPCMVLPSSLMATVNFWAMYTLAPHLVEDIGVMQLYILPWYNHCIHTLVAPIAFMEMLVTPRVFPKLSVVFLVTPIFIVGYGIVVFIFNYVGNTWPYPMYAMMTNTHWVVYGIANCALGLMAHFIGRAFNTAVWGQQAIAEKRESSNGYQHRNGKLSQNGYQKKKVK